MARFATTTGFAAILALAGAAATALPASATETTTSSHQGYSRQAAIARHHARIRHDAYHVGYERGFRDGHLAELEGGPVVSGRSVAVGGPAYDGPLGDGGLLGNGGLLGTGVLGGNGVLGTGVLNGQGALGVGILGF